jgi:hypothetical protein
LRDRAIHKEQAQANDIVNMKSGMLVEKDVRFVVRFAACEEEADVVVVLWRKWLCRRDCVAAEDERIYSVA